MGTTTHCVTIETEICCVCGAAFGLEEHFKCRRKEDHAAFYCPNGHILSYQGKSQAEKLKDELTSLKAKKDQLDQELVDKDKKIKNIEKRVANGVCPCCSRTFKNLQRHMKTKHRDLVKTVNE